jgi:ribosomal protein S18 acetylase RimI-like enzyme
VQIITKITLDIEKQIISLDKESFANQDDYWEENKSLELFKQNKKIELAAINGDELMGYILCLALTKKEYEKIRKGEHLESDIGINDVIAKDKLRDATNLYFSIIAIKPKYQGLRLGNILLESLNIEIEKYNVSRILAYVVSSGGMAITKKLGLKEIGKNIEGASIMEKVLK